MKHKEKKKLCQALFTGYLCNVCNKGLSHFIFNPTFLYFFFWRVLIIHPYRHVPRRKNTFIWILHFVKLENQSSAAISFNGCTETAQLSL